MTEQDIYNEIATILINAGPQDAKKIIMRAELHSDNDVCQYEFDYIYGDNKLDWFDPDGRAVGDLTEVLVKLRNYFVDNFKSEEKPFWHGCEVTVDVESLKIHIDFKYD